MPLSPSVSSGFSCAAPLLPASFLPNLFSSLKRNNCDKAAKLMSSHCSVDITALSSSTSKPRV